MSYKDALIKKLINPEQSIQENKIAPEKGGIMDKLPSTTSGAGVKKLTDKKRKENQGGVIDKLASNTSGAGVGSLSSMGAGYEGLRFAKRNNR